MIGVYMERKHLLWFVGLAIISALTLLTSLEHHSQIAKRYGEIAVVYTPAIVLSSYLLGGFISFTLQRGIREVELKQILRLLPKNEQKVLGFLYERGGTMQSELVPQTQLSKGVVSKIVSDYEGRKILKRMNMEDGYLVELTISHSSRTYQAAKRLPGLTERNLVVIIALVFMFGFLFSALNSLHIYTLDHALRPEMYLLAIEFLALGGLTALTLKDRISRGQLEKTLKILPPDDEKLMKVILDEKKILQQDLVDKTGVYKMKVSRLMHKFEDAGVVEKKQYGNTNLIMSKIN